MGRIIGIAFGGLSYFIFFGVFLYAIGFIGGFITPTKLDGPVQAPLPKALAINITLLSAFAIQHSGMARPAFKRWLTKFIPASVERSSYVLVSSLLMIAFFVYWQPIGGALWAAPEGFARNLIILLNLFGWGLLLYATFLLDHFELFGLKQVWQRLRGAPSAPSKFRTPGLYRIVRHPIYIGWLVIFWAAPTMTVGHLIFALGTTAYILIAIQFEERDLIAEFGERYQTYKRQVPMLIPRFRRNRSSQHQSQTSD